MKKSILSVLIIVAVVSAQAFLAFAEQRASGGKITAYYFHGSFRCPTCFNMEKYSKEALETNFKDALASGSLEFKVVNVEDKGNEHYTNDYQLYTKSLILSFVKDGKEVKSKNLTKIWDYARDKQKFIAYVTEETKAFLEEAR